jgi:hypothetical protein
MNVRFEKIGLRDCTECDDGVIVGSVEPGSIAELSDFPAGFVITHIGRRPIKDVKTPEWRPGQVVTGQLDGKPLKILIVAPPPPSAKFLELKAAIDRADAAQLLELRQEIYRCGLAEKEAEQARERIERRSYKLKEGSKLPELPLKGHGLRTSASAASEQKASTPSEKQPAGARPNFYRERDAFQDRITRDSRLTAPLLRLCFVIARNACSEAGPLYLRTWLASRTYAKEANISVNNVPKYLRALHGYGIIEATYQGSNKPFLVRLIPESPAGNNAGQDQPAPSVPNYVPPQALARAIETYRPSEQMIQERRPSEAEQQSAAQVVDPGQKQSAPPPEAPAMIEDGFTEQQKAAFAAGAAIPLRPRKTEPESPEVDEWWRREQRKAQATREMIDRTFDELVRRQAPRGDPYDQGEYNVFPTAGTDKKL